MNTKSLNILLIFSILFIFSCTKEGDVASSAVLNGKSSSMARIITIGNYIYAVNNNSLNVIDISDNSNPIFIKNVSIGMSIETIFSFGNHLFIGSNSAMYIYGLADPTNPTAVSTFYHMTGCDPVVANDSLAFITIHHSTNCANRPTNGQIDIIDIKNIYNPILLKTYLTNTDPLGLDYKDSVLFVCHGTAGIIAYHIAKLALTIENPIISSYSKPGFTAYDATVWQNKLFVIGDNGFYQFDYSDIHDLKLISSILKND